MTATTGTTARDRVLGALHDAGCSVTAGGTSARCPAHEDHAPSLSIGQRRDGDGVLVRCHAGCETTDVLAALNLTAADLFDTPRQGRSSDPGRPQVVQIYPYVDEDGEVLFEKVRLVPKSFRQRRPDGAGGWTWKLGDVRRVLYRLPDVVAAVAAGDPVYVTEGEKDADALAAAGVTATTWTDGAWQPGSTPKWRRAYTDALAGAHVVVVADRDDAGRHTAAGVAAVLAPVAASVAVVEAAAGKDAADHLAAGRTVAQLVSVDHLDEPGQPVPDTAGPVPHERDEGRVPASARLVRLAEHRYRLAATPTGEPFAVPLEGPPVARLLRGGSDSLRAALADAFHTEAGRVPSQQALADAMVVLEGRAVRGIREELHLRVAETDAALWLDLGDDTGRAVQVTSQGWDVCSTPPVLFRRTALTGPLPEPTRDGDLAALWPLLNVSVDDRPLVLAVLIAQLLPGIPHPVVTLGGEQGTGKSTAARILAGLLDPSPVQLRKPPRDVESWTTAAAGSWVVAVDNLSGLPDWLSDSLCRAVTGDGDVRRRLYSDADLYVVAFRRCVILNGIDLGTVRDDLADRLVSIGLDRISDRVRRYDADLARGWADAHPRVLGGVLDLAVRVLAAMPSTHLPDPPRMADFARVLLTVDATLGTAGLARYRAKAGELAADAVTGDPVLVALTAAITVPWTGTAAELLTAITPEDHHPGRDWPKGARALAGLLKRRAPSLRRVGWTVEQTTERTERGMVWRLLPPAHPWLTSPDETADGMGSSGFRQDSRQDQPPIVTCEDTEPGPNPDGMTNNPVDLALRVEGREGEGTQVPASRDHPDSSSFRQPVRTRALTLPTQPDPLSVFAPPTGRGRCSACGWHTPTQGHRPDCTERTSA